MACECLLYKILEDLLVLPVRKGEAVMLENNNEWMEEIKKTITKEKGTVYCEKLIKKIEENERLAFLDGYLYAIRVLESGLVG